MTDSKKKNRSYWITYNNPLDDWQVRYEQWFHTGKLRYLVGGAEVGESGTPHIQTHVDLNNASTIIAVQKQLKKVGIKATVGAYKSKQHTINGRNYTLKDGDFKQWGEIPAQGRRNDIKDYQEFIAANPTTDRKVLFEQHATVMAKYPRFADEYRNMCQSFPTLGWTDTPPNLWVWGPPGSGKSRPYQEQDCRPYLKMANKWWTGYDNHADVLMEDLDPSIAKFLGHRIKIWADRYPFQVCIHGSMMTVRPQRLIITSNYRISEMGWDEAMSSAIARRFTVIHKPGPPRIPAMFISGDAAINPRNPWKS